MHGEGRILREKANEKHRGEHMHQRTYNQTNGSISNEQQIQGANNLSNEAQKPKAINAPTTNDNRKEYAGAAVEIWCKNALNSSQKWQRCKHNETHGSKSTGAIER